MIVRDLIELDKKGYEITFDIVDHPNTPNNVYVNGCSAKISLATYNAFQKYKNGESNI